MMRSVAILGGGAWGTALAAHAARSDLKVRQWVREVEVVEAIKASGRNELFLPGVDLPAGIEPTTDLREAVEGVDWILAVVPTQHARAIYAQLVDILPPLLPVVAANKGIEEGSLMLPIDVIRDELGGGRPLAVLSGPSFAAGVAGSLPTALVAASEDAALRAGVQQAFAASTMRVYTNEDPVGVQVGGALKNVMALAAGILDGLKVGANGRAAMITRGLAEMTRLGVQLGGRAETFAGLAGLGDLVLTATDEQSRNFSVGRRIGSGESLQEILQKSRTVAEGVRTTRAAYSLSQREAVAMPIVQEMHHILYEDGRPRDAVQRLMDRPLIAEHGDYGASEGQDR